MPSDRDPTWRLRGFAWVMRHEPTDAEKLLWSRLRDRQLGGFKFRRQVSISAFIVDFYCLEQKLAIELDGGQHGDDDSVEYDRRRDMKLREFGIRVFRFSNDDILKDADSVLRQVLEVLDQNPHPTLSRGTGRGERE